MDLENWLWKQNKIRIRGAIRHKLRLSTPYYLSKKDVDRFLARFDEFQRRRGCGIRRSRTSIRRRPRVRHLPQNACSTIPAGAPRNVSEVWGRHGTGQKKCRPDVGLKKHAAEDDSAVLRVSRRDT